MNREGYPESYWPQQYLSLSQEKSEQDVNGEVQDDTELAHYNTEMDSAGLYEERVGLGSSSESCPLRGEDGVDGFGLNKQMSTFRR